jgi:hypothetical protein
VIERPPLDGLRRQAEGGNSPNVSHNAWARRLENFRTTPDKSGNSVHSRNFANCVSPV